MLIKSIDSPSIVFDIVYDSFYFFLFQWKIWRRLRYLSCTYCKNKTIRTVRYIEHLFWLKVQLQYTKIEINLFQATLFVLIMYRCRRKMSEIESGEWKEIWYDIMWSRAEMSFRRSICGENCLRTQFSKWKHFDKLNYISVE